MLASPRRPQPRVSSTPSCHIILPLMRPTPRACRAAAHSIVPRNPQALWITDEVLADALHRYTQLSDVAKRSGSKRFGSNVPGPLEARKRLAGRRMGGLSSAVGPPNALPDFGALFGGPSAGRTPIEKSWRWEPPRPVAHQSLTPPDECPTPAPTFEIPDLQFAEYDPVEHFRERLQSVKRPNNAYTLMKKYDIEPEDRVAFSQVACDHFIARITADRRDGHKNLFNFVLDNPHDVIEAGNVKRVVQHLAGTGFFKSHNLDDFVSDFLPSACRREKISASDLSEVLELLPSVCHNSFKHDEFEAKSWLFKAYWKIWRVLGMKEDMPWKSLNIDTLRKVAECIMSLPDALPTSFRQYQDRNVDTTFLPFRLHLYTSAWPVTLSRSERQSPHYILASWARQLVGLEPSKFSNLNGLNWQILTSVIDYLPTIKAQWAMTAATRQLFDDRVDQQSSEFLPAWISCLSRSRHCCTLNIPSYRLEVFEMVPALAVRVDPVVAAQHLDNADPVNLARGWLRAWLPLYAGEFGVSSRWDAQHAKLKVAFEEGVRMLNKLHGYDDTRMFELIFRLLADFRIPCQNAVEHAMKLLLAKHGPDEIFRLLQRLQTRDIFLQNPTFLAPIIEFLAEYRPMRAYEIYKKTPGMWVSLCPNLPLTLIAQGALKREEFFALVNRWPKVRKDDLSEEEIAAKKNELALLRSEMVHFAAFAWADADILPTRVRLRNVWWCWRYLLDMKLPLSPLLSKAFVRSAITAPLQRRQWVSRKKMTWVFEKFVRPLEGEWVERELGVLVHAWRGDLIQEARRRWDAAGLFDRYGPSTVEMVRRAGLFEHDFPRRNLVRRKYVRPGRNAAERFPRLWSDRTYSVLPARDLLRWSRTPVVGCSRSCAAGPNGYPVMLLNGRWRTWFKSAMKRWRQRKEQRRALRATKKNVRTLLKSGEVANSKKSTQLKNLKRDIDMVRRRKTEKSMTMAKLSPWERARLETGKTTKGKPVPIAPKPGTSLVRKVNTEGRYLVPQTRRWKR
ncbi:hypothetical protein IWX49DRAFT_551581 [Phyllosticta citricarpa]|uniref:Uncharacterized protein n=2 Tax=Phyllosticta TaxID=121621 RepID=A0ABR1MHC2_9PEZI